MSADLLQDRFRKVNIEGGAVYPGLSSQVVEVGGQCYRGEGCVIKGGESSIRLQQLYVDPRWGEGGAKGSS